MRMTRMIQFGSWIMTTWRICTACSRKLMVRLLYYAHVKNRYHTYALLNFCHVIVIKHDLMSKLMVLFLSILARERIVGWYHTGPKLHKNDIAINELMKQYCSNSVCNTICLLLFQFILHTVYQGASKSCFILNPKGFSHH